MEITIDDLIQKCVMCGGTGKHPLPENPSDHSGSSFGRREVILFPDTCSACQGTGKGALTPTGQALKQFLEILKKKQML